ncbi:MAG: LPP20 family lipoprotein [Gemmatimonadales bacterium]|nr:LPP20 family lipoprotein [Gemmatimonadales bacterium]
MTRAAPGGARALLLLLALLAVASPAAAQGPAPAWVTRRPVDREAYIGIGYVAKEGRTGGHLARARSVALADMAAEIVTSVSSQFLRKQVEDASGFSEEVKTGLKANTVAKLQGYEQVATWEDDQRFWAYYRLEKAKWEELRFGPSSRARQVGLQLYEAAEAAARQGDGAAAVGGYLKALQAVQAFFGEPLMVESGAERADLVDLAYGALQRYVTSWRLVPAAGTIRTVAGAAPATVDATLATEKGTPVGGIPAGCTFSAGGGRAGDPGTSGPDGVIRCPIRALGVGAASQAVDITLDLSTLVSPDDSVGEALQKLISGVTPPRARVTFEVGRRTVALAVTETNLGQPVAPAILAPLARQSLSEGGVTVADGGAPHTMTIAATTREQGTARGMVTVAVDVNVTVTETATGRQVYAGAYTARGVDLNAAQAGQRGLRAAAQQLKARVLPELLRTWR